MKTLILPICGKSTRFPNLKPKWMLTHPRGNFMITEAIRGLNLDFFDKIFVVCLKEHEKQFSFLKGLLDEWREFDFSAKTEIVFLDEATKSQPETVYTCIQQERIEGFVFVKDCDNFFKLNISSPTNTIAYCDLHDLDEVNAANKSYVKVNKQGIVESIVEKTITSSYFCCGGYGFASADDFVSSYEKLVQINPNLYISDIVFDLLLKGEIFHGVNVNEYKDWGTIKEWNNYRKQHRTLFIDLDGTLVENSSSHFPPYIGKSKPLTKNIEFLKGLQNTYVVITTSRAEKFRSVTEKQLNDLGIPYHQLVMGLPHCQRVVINDFSDTNTYPSCSAVNFIRDNDDLEKYL